MRSSIKSWCVQVVRAFGLIGLGLVGALVVAGCGVSPPPGGQSPPPASEAPFGGSSGSPSLLDPQGPLNLPPPPPDLVVPSPSAPDVQVMPPPAPEVVAPPPPSLSGPGYP
ncbi:MAG TPA: hypothetical protein VKA46_43480 [Gemmataceae bacterium]|nr:hypothetical protein [Gemmataceae bacterium]